MCQEYDTDDKSNKVHQRKSGEFQKSQREEGKKNHYCFIIPQISNVHILMPFRCMYLHMTKTAGIIL